MKKKIALTFDHEIFFNKSGTVEKCILEPVNELIDLFIKYNIKGTFFVDTIFIQRLLEENDETKIQAKLIIDQLKKLVEIGSRIELHLHPHWLDAKYCSNTKEWTFLTYQRFRLESLSQDKIDELFKTGVDLLNDIARKVNPNYKVCSFRAGGYCVEPFNKLIFSFISNGILIDSSVTYGRQGDSITHKYDFLNHPNKVIYKFSKNTSEEEEHGKFFEIPVSTYKINAITKFNQLISRRLFKKRYQPMGDGSGMFDNEKSKLIKLFDLLLEKNNYQSYSLEGTNSPKRFIRRIEQDNKEIINVISHPKSLSNNSINIIKELCKKYEFITLDQLLRTS